MADASHQADNLMVKKKTFETIELQDAEGDDFYMYTMPGGNVTFELRPNTDEYPWMQAAEADLEIDSVTAQKIIDVFREFFGDKVE